MRRIHKMAVTVACGFALAVTSAQARTQINVTFDEMGNGSIQFEGGSTYPMPWSLSPDSGPGGLASALTYSLQALTIRSQIAGDVLIYEDINRTVLSDLIRFNLDPTSGAMSMVVYSDNNEPDRDLADVGFPTGSYPTPLALVEVGLEGGQNGVVYTPGLGQPGYINSDFPITFTFISDAAVPEPTTMIAGALLLLPVALQGIRMLRNRKQTA